MANDTQPQKIENLQRSISWKEGLFIATGVPLLVLPSIGFFGATLWAFSILVWVFSVIQGFLQCTAYAELATVYKDQAGLPGFVYQSFKNRNKFIPALGAWGYWFAWNPVLAIMALLLGDYLHGFFFPHVEAFTLSLIFGGLMIIILVVINYFGLMAGAYAQLALAIFSLIPLTVLSIAPFVTGHVDYSNFTRTFLPPDWSWLSWKSWFIFIGIMALAQWSACAWETAAVYASEYKDPTKDTPKALFSAGALCLIIFPLAQAAAIGTLGVEGLAKNPYSPFVPIAQEVLGHAGATVALIMLIASLILISNTALMGSSRALYTMAKDGQIPAVFGRVNKHSQPLFSVIVIAIFNMALIFLKTPILVLATSAVGYVIINGLTLIGYILTRIDYPHLDRPFKAPAGWVIVVAFFALLNIPFYLIGNVWSSGLLPTILGAIVLLTVLPLYLYTKYTQNKMVESSESADAAGKIDG